MTLLEHGQKCKACEFGSLLRYADGHYSIQCNYDIEKIVVSTKTTRDIVLLDHCPKDDKKDSAGRGFHKP